MKEEDVAVIEKTDTLLRLVGAMFTTPAEFGCECGKKGLDRY